MQEWVRGQNSTNVLHEDFSVAAQLLESVLLPLRKNFSLLVSDLA